MMLLVIKMYLPHQLIVSVTTLGPYHFLSLYWNLKKSFQQYNILYICLDDLGLRNQDLPNI